MLQFNFYFSFQYLAVQVHFTTWILNIVCFAPPEVTKINPVSSGVKCVQLELRLCTKEQRTPVNVPVGGATCLHCRLTITITDPIL